MRTGRAIGLGAGLAAATVAAAVGGYFLTGNRAAKTKRIIKSWMLKARAEVMEQIESLQDIGQDTYENIVETVADKYSKIAGVSRDEIDDLVRDLKKQWKVIAKSRTGNGNGNGRRTSNTYSSNASQRRSKASGDSDRSETVQKDNKE